MKSTSTNGSLLLKSNLGFYRNLALLNSISMKSQKGNMPVPPQTMMILPFGASARYFIPDPIGCDIMIEPSNLGSNSFDVSFPDLYFFITSGIASVSPICCF
jgi:hypothetical protein